MFLLLSRWKECPSTLSTQYCLSAHNALVIIDGAVKLKTQVSLVMEFPMLQQKSNVHITLNNLCWMTNVLAQT
jgi:hypothetical protein